MRPQPAISVIIPTLNEEASISGCIDAVRAEDAGIGIIVADGGSEDRTCETVLRHGGVQLVRTGRGRGQQLNSGAEAATGDILLFLHADTVLEQGWSGALRRAYAAEEDLCGAFTFAVDDPSWRFRTVEQWVALRCALCRLPYGDQGLFVARSLFDRIGGFHDMPLMEDVELVRRMKKSGRLRILDHRAFTSARRWQRKGVLRTALLNQFVMTLYLLGADPGRLYRIYYR